MVAYRRVTHITFIIVGLVTRNKLIIAVVFLMSLAHGWAAISLFLIAGSIRHGAGSRLSNFLGSEGALHWVIIVLGILLVSNARVPPMPAFFSELLLLLIATVKRGASIVMFLGVRLVVCYYNAYFFLCVRHMKPFSVINNRIKPLNGFIIVILLTLSLETLLMLVFF